MFFFGTTTTCCGSLLLASRYHDIILYDCHTDVSSSENVQKNIDIVRLHIIYVRIISSEVNVFSNINTNNLLYVLGSKPLRAVHRVLSDKILYVYDT